MAYQSKYRHVPVEDIRAASITYEQLVMRSFDRLNILISNATKEEVFKPIEANLRYIDSLFYPYWSDDKEYQEHRKSILKRLRETNIETFDCYPILMEWVRLLTTKFNKVNILPMEKMSFVAGKGKVDDNVELFE